MSCKPGAALFLTMGLVVACGDNHGDHGPIADGISAPMGDPIPTATAEQLATFERGLDVAVRRFDVSAGLGPAFNVTFCGSCHEKPVIGGSAGLYRNFFLAGQRLDNGPFLPGHGVSLFDCGDIATPPAERVRNPPTESATGMFAGVLRIYGYGESVLARPDPVADLNVFAQRNPIPFFGVGLLAELPEDEILRRADPDDADGDGISGRPNIDRGFVGRFGRKSQTVSIEGFIRGPLFNHLGITTDPLSDAQRAQLPVDSALEAAEQNSIVQALQAAAPSGPNCDVDVYLDPEMSTDDLFDLVSFSMLLAAPEFDPLNDRRRRGLALFDRARCGDCHTPRLNGPRGPLPVYSDLLLHDMGEELADGIEMGEASGREFRTHPLWGLAATGPYLHDGRAHTLSQAILLHGGEGSASRDRFADFTESQKADLIEFLLSLGGRSQASAGLLKSNEPVPPAGQYGGPLTSLSAEQAQRFEDGRALFDREFGVSEGLGGTRFNGDSCRACHFEPILGGAGPRGVNVMRHGSRDGDAFIAPLVGTIMHKVTAALGVSLLPELEATVFEHRQTPPLFGLGLIDGIAEANILINEDPTDLNGDGISGRAHMVSGGRVGRFGWKAQVPSLAEFVRDAVGAELGMTLPPAPGLTFGRTSDDDNVADPELTQEDARLLEDFMAFLAPPPRQPGADAPIVLEGESLFGTVGCSDCHIPALTGADGPVPLYSDLLLHDMLAADADGIADGQATMREFRTAPLWGISQTGPYLHSGVADTLDEAIRGHDGEAIASRDAYLALDSGDQAKLIQFLDSL